MSIVDEISLNGEDDLERVIEGGEDKQYVSGNESGNDKKKEDEENEKEKVKIKRKTGPRPVLNAERLKGLRGIGIMESFFADINLHGKGREKEDLDLVMGRLEHWTHRLYPRMQFDDCLKKIEKLGSKKEIQNYVKRIRLGMEEEEVARDVLLDNQPDSPPPAPSLDPFDQLVVTSPSASVRPPTTEITAEQRERMLRNRLMAEERRAARIKKAEDMKKKFQTQLNLTQTGNTETQTGNTETQTGNTEIQTGNTETQTGNTEACDELIEGAGNEDVNGRNLVSDAMEDETGIQSDVLVNNFVNGAHMITSENENPMVTHTTPV